MDENKKEEQNKARVERARYRLSQMTMDQCKEQRKEDVERAVLRRVLRKATEEDQER